MEARPLLGRSARERAAKIEVRRFREVAKAAQPADVREVLAARGAEQLRRLASVDLGGGLQEEDRVDDEAREREPRVGDALLAADEVLVDERPIRPGQDVVMHLVDLAERRP